MTRRVRATFWALVVTAVAGTGALTASLSARSGPVAGLSVASASVTVVASALLALRILIVVEREHSRQ